MPPPLELLSRSLPWTISMQTRNVKINKINLDTMVFLQNRPKKILEISDLEKNGYLSSKLLTVVKITKSDLTTNRLTLFLSFFVCFSFSDSCVCSMASWLRRCCVISCSNSSSLRFLPCRSISLSSLSLWSSKA